MHSRFCLLGVSTTFCRYDSLTSLASSNRTRPGPTYGRKDLRWLGYGPFRAFIHLHSFECLRPKQRFPRVGAKAVLKQVGRA